MTGPYKTVSGMKRVRFELHCLLEYKNQKSPKELVDTVLKIKN